MRTGTFNSEFLLSVKNTSIVRLNSIVISVNAAALTSSNQCRILKATKLQICKTQNMQDFFFFIFIYIKWNKCDAIYVLQKHT